MYSLCNQISIIKKEHVIANFYICLVAFASYSDIINEIYKKSSLCALCMLVCYEKYFINR